MLFVWIALWGIALFLIAIEPRSASIRWLSLVAFCGGAGALAATVDLRIIPAMEESLRVRWEPVLYRMQVIASLTSYYGLPFAFFMYAITFRPIRLPAAWRQLIPVLLLAMIAAMVLFTPAYTELHPVVFKLIVWWAVPLMLFGIVHILIRRPQHPSYLATYRVVCLTVLLPISVSMVLSYLLPAFGMLGMWVYNTWFVAAGVCFFVIGLFTYGFMGLRVLIDRRRLDSAFRAVTSGTAILNHAIKNDAAKLRLFGNKIHQRAAASGDQELLADINVMLSASLHMQEMIARVHQKTEDLVLRPSLTEPELLIREVLQSLSPQMDKIALHTTLAGGWSCMLDKAQAAEAIGNVLHNAIEAMQGQGKLEVVWRAAKKEFTLEISDNGPGMDAAQARRAMDPFYTTKSGSGANYGLGLPYAYQVMRKHGGTLKIHSKSGMGTRVFLIFPKKPIHAVQMDQMPPKENGEAVEGGEAENGERQGARDGEH